ncbi:MAG TPA: Hsp33 family molecular chaperone HslO [bacterium]|nr:Hsp33 family molecular chaperone HslO [bacterium]
MSDYLVRGVTKDGEFRFTASTTRDIVEEGRRRHDTRSGSTKVLGEALTAVSLLHTQLKGDEKISLQITSDGLVSTLLTDVDAAGNVRGFISNPNVYAELPDAPAGPPPFGMQGLIIVIRSTPTEVKSRGTVPLTTGEVAQDVANYLTTSEQVHSALALDVSFEEDRARSVHSAGGILLQALPGADKEKFLAYRRVLSDPHLHGRMFFEGSRPEDAVETLMNAVEHESPYEILDRHELKFQCQCSREKVADSLRMLGKDDLAKMRDEDGHAEVICRFCNEKYVLDRAELGVLMATLDVKN